MVNTITAVKEAQRHHKVHKQQDKQAEYKEPSKYMLMLHMNTRGPKRAVYVVAHLLADHLHVGEHEATDIIKQALRDGKHPIKPVTKDVGESLLREISACPDHADMSEHFNITLEKQ